VFHLQDNVDDVESNAPSPSASTSPSLSSPSPTSLQNNNNEQQNVEQPVVVVEEVTLLSETSPTLEQKKKDEDEEKTMSGITSSSPSPPQFLQNEDKQKKNKDDEPMPFDEARANKKKKDEEAMLLTETTCLSTSRALVLPPKIERVIQADPQDNVHHDMQKLNSTFKTLLKQQKSSVEFDDKTVDDGQANKTDPQDSIHHDMHEQDETKVDDGLANNTDPQDNVHHDTQEQNKKVDGGQANKKGSDASKTKQERTKSYVVTKINGVTKIHSVHKINGVTKISGGTEIHGVAVETPNNKSSSGTKGHASKFKRFMALFQRRLSVSSFCCGGGDVTSAVANCPPPLNAEPQERQHGLGKSHRRSLACTSLPHESTPSEEELESTCAASTTAARL
jgi:hypothetical protein